MSVTSYVYPKALVAIGTKTIDLTSDTFKAILLTGDASTFGSTQEGYQYVSDVTTAYTECTDGDYSRTTLTSLALAASTSKVKWSCANIDFGSDVTITARSIAIADTSIGSAVDSATPVICIIDLGENVISSAGEWEYEIDGTNGLFTLTVGTSS